jgi:hypothetical protein
MGSPSTYNFTDRIIALAVVTLAVALFIKHGDTVALSRLSPSSSPDYVQHEQKIHGHSVLVHFVVYGAAGFLYLLAVDGLAFLVGVSRGKAK